MAVLYNGLQRIAPVVVEGTGTSISATNQSSSAVSAGDKVWINESNGSYDIIDFAEKKYNNFRIIGSSLSVSEESGIVHNFSNADFLQLEQPFAPENDPWEVKIKIITGNDVSTEQEIFQSCLNNNLAGRYGLCFGILSSKFNFFCSYNGSSWLFDLTGSHNVQPNTTYYIKAGWTGTEYYLDYSLDGVTYMRDITYISYQGLIAGISYSYIGIYSTEQFKNYFRGYVYLSDTAAYINGNLEWEPYKMVTAVEQSSITGKAEENIAINGTGQVSVIL